MKVLDHGSVELIETWGSDERIIEAARMSTGKGFLGWGPKCKTCGDTFDAPERDCPNPAPGTPLVDCGRGGHTFNAPGDEKLLAFLWHNKHATPFEMAGAVIEVQAPIFVFREWHRHRTQCLAGSTELHFDLPVSIAHRGTRLYKRTIRQIVEAFERSDFARNRIRGMLLRGIDEDTHEVTYKRIVNAWRSGVKDVYDITLGNGTVVRMSAEHRVHTDLGWKRLHELEGSNARISSIGAEHEAVARSMPEFTADELMNERWADIDTDGRYHVSSLGRVRSIFNRRGHRRTQPLIKVPTPTANGYLAVSMSKDGVSRAFFVHQLVADAFVAHGFGKPEGAECMHLNGNGWDNRVGNLAFGTAQENAAGRAEHDPVPRLRHNFQPIRSIKYVGEEETFDIEVAGPYHNFSANGMIVHNSYNEMSARYTPLPDVNYLPTVNRLLINSSVNRQAGTINGAGNLTAETAEMFRHSLRKSYTQAEELYQWALNQGVPKELARVHLPVGRYSRMRASAVLRNWLAFLTLRMASGAQWEIQEYARAVHGLLSEKFPRTLALFDGSTP